MRQSFAIPLKAGNPKKNPRATTSGAKTSKPSKPRRVLSSLELFSGAGGLALGLHKAGFDCRGLVEWDKFAADTLKDNSQRVLGIDPSLVHHADLRSLDFSRHEGAIDLVAGGPPCQPFSTAGLNRGQHDARNMFPAFIDVVRQVRPKAIMMENVKGLLRPRFQPYVKYLLLRLRFPHHLPHEGESWDEHYQRISKSTKGSFHADEQYEVGYQLIDAADFGVSQRRARVIFTAFRSDLCVAPVYMRPTHSRLALLADQFITGRYWERHGIRPRRDHLLKNEVSKLDSLFEDFFERFGSSPKAWSSVRDAISDLPKPVARGEEPSIANHVQHPGARIYRCHIGSYWDYPAKALKAGTNGTPGGENILRHSNVEGDPSVRYFTTREAARLQGFPDDWEFHGTWGACIKQLGNAVPVKIAENFAAEIKKRIYANAA
jgi:DNA (cytosine-5)-methyltransferase 1